MRRTLGAGGLVVLLAVSGLPVFTYAATLRTGVTVDHARVRLSDLFSGLGAGQDMEIGDAPALGANYAVGGPQLTAIAAQFGVDWPDASPLVSITLTRATRLVTEEDVLPVIRQELDLPPGGHVEISLSGFRPVAAPLEDRAAPVLLHLEAPKRGAEHFSARLEIPSAHGGQPTVFNVNGTVTMEVRAVVLRHALHSGQLILPDDITTGLIRASQLPEDALQSPEDGVGLEARTGLLEGQALGASMLVHPQIVHRGSPVVASFTSGGLHLTVSGTVLEAAGKGDTVHVYNPNSRMILTARVLDRTEVDVIPGIMPLSADSRQRPSTPSLPTL
ncbi:flagellar basal body P-ring formation chaperone FlgA [Gluconobacter morbifer]|uniref:Flagellar basal body P-ring biosynthesis protein FlgA n=1 Tax=Gluconobacter morbifer G707 TaxID=1088869 RepID=G6XJF9_9PROT|nr:flagellar basal body P-ring formation chaperone FlgA [Gluconobacter morbifer]EHH68064.1 flagellar basal body P-ring biosynthesis protein FlgA [Gluconobacter morbifer G707]